MDGLAVAFLKLIPGADPWVDPYSLSLYTVDPTLVGNYTITYMVSLPMFPMVMPLLVDFRLTIEFSSNNFPYFEPKL